MTNEEIERLKAENASLRQELERLKNEIIRPTCRTMPNLWASLSCASKQNVRT